MAVSWVIFFSGLVSVLAEPTCYPQFKCHPNSTTTYEMNGMIMDCQSEDFICNDGYSSDCEPCIVPGSSTCGFICLNSSESGGTFLLKNTVALQTFTCPAGQVCNNLYNSCRPCICKGPWVCNKKNLREVTVFGMTIPCPDEKICNIKNEDPCEACIAKPFPTEKFPPNCDDGFSDTYPCRTGPKGDHYYYHCKKRSNNKYDYMIKLCKGLSNDAECNNQDGLKLC